ncbi:mitochondrial import inner membrane translocase subunit TIM50-like [Ptychodera flava]|uniref:mitochondrial import inner membrane translocase subunit TIM50-like n=1 Tax=Ptychodera flava TaxID=63121 RepID=UPI00396A3297
MATIRRICTWPCASYFRVLQRSSPTFRPCLATGNLVNRTFLPIGRLNFHSRLYATSQGEGTATNTTTQSYQPLGSIMKEAEDRLKAKQQEEEDKKKKGKTGFARAQKWAFIITFGSLGLAAVLAIIEFGEPQKDEEGNRIADEFDDNFVVWAYIQRTIKWCRNYRTMIVEPTAEKLLPDPVKAPFYQPPYTLVLEMKNVLVHPEWTYGTGWRFKKRPGVDFFLSQVGPPLFEVVLYTQEQSLTGYPLVDKLDPNGYITYRLFRDATRYMDGHHVKDLSSLNRELSKIIIVDYDKKSYQLHPNNAIGLKAWEGNDDDRALFDLAIFLRTIAASGVEDVRTVLEHYRLEDDPLEAFKRNQARLQEEKSYRQADKPQTSLTGGLTKGLFGRNR